MKTYFNNPMNPWRGIVATSMIIGAAAVSVVFGIMAMLILRQD